VFQNHCCATNDELPRRQVILLTSLPVIINPFDLCWVNSATPVERGSADPVCVDPCKRAAGIELQRYQVFCFEMTTPLNGSSSKLFVLKKVHTTQSRNLMSVALRSNVLNDRFVMYTPI